MFWREVAVWEDKLGEFNSVSDNLSASVFIQVKLVFWEVASILDMLLEAYLKKEPIGNEKLFWAGMWKWFTARIREQYLDFSCNLCELLECSIGKEVDWERRGKEVWRVEGKADWLVGGEE